MNFLATMAVTMVSLFGQGLEVSDTLLESILLLLGGDALLDVLDDPVDHVFLLVGSQNVGGLQLVVQATLHLQNHWTFNFGNPTIGEHRLVL